VATVLIIGASRGIGLETVKAALEAGYSVRALARSARRIPVDHPKLEKMAGDARVYDDKDVQERIVRRSKLDWVIVRPVILTDGPKTNAYRALLEPPPSR
jgi:NAD(P)-dependent dehydrogenase (short-subunit alcohol dehydrogenase family)